ncbi:MAG TPA: MYXO-CTERM sorting domain-containing protein [Polyangiaceae bacterium]|nr:MYXO-CTERM sorting domain-containing protein [Polyangiaceae bacterium]
MTGVCPGCGLIYAATGDVAFGETAFYDAHSAAKLGSLAFSSKVYALNPHGSDFWVFDSSANLLRHFVDSDATNAGNGGAGNGGAGNGGAGGAGNGGAGGAAGSTTGPGDAGASTDAGGSPQGGDGGASTSDEAGQAGASTSSTNGGSSNIGLPSAGHGGATTSNGGAGGSAVMDPVNDESKACGCAVPGRESSPWHGLAGVLGLAILALRTRRRVSVSDARQ